MLPVCYDVRGRRRPVLSPKKGGRHSATVSIIRYMAVQRCSRRMILRRVPRQCVDDTWAKAQPRAPQFFHAHAVSPFTSTSRKSLGSRYMRNKWLSEEIRRSTPSIPTPIHQVSSGIRVHHTKRIEGRGVTLVEEAYCSTDGNGSSSKPLSEAEKQGPGCARPSQPPTNSRSSWHGDRLDGYRRRRRRHRVQEAIRICTVSHLRGLARPGIRCAPSPIGCGDGLHKHATTPEITPWAMQAANCRRTAVPRRLCTAGAHM